MLNKTSITLKQYITIPSAVETQRKAQCNYRSLECDLFINYENISHVLGISPKKCEIHLKTSDFTYEVNLSLDEFKNQIQNFVNGDKT